jgi:response regulator RpfG family c-di-GMP phosphodiesterase
LRRFREGLRVVRSHHERWDGTAYPDRLAGADIPLSAHAGTQFDPDVIDGVVACEADLVAIRNPSLEHA